jgi:hypothetical protein
MKFLLFDLLVSFSLGVLATPSHNVRGYTKKDGTYVKGHRATNPNKTQRDNWSSKPNANPYTGKKGTKEPKK